MTVQAYPITILHAGEDHVEKVKTLSGKKAATLEAAKRGARDEGYLLLSDHGEQDECQFDENKEEWIITTR